MSSSNLTIGRVDECVNSDMALKRFSQLLHLTQTENQWNHLKVTNQSYRLSFQLEHATVNRSSIQISTKLTNISKNVQLLKVAHDWITLQVRTTSALLSTHLHKNIIAVLFRLHYCTMQLMTEPEWFLRPLCMPAANCHITALWALSPFCLQSLSLSHFL